MARKPTLVDLSKNPDALRIARAGRSLATFLCCYGDELPHAEQREKARQRLAAWLKEMETVQPF